MHYCFDVEHAKTYGVNEAIILQNLLHWIRKNAANGKHFYDGRTWTYNSMKAFEKLFPFWSARQVRYALESLIDKKILITGNWNKSSYDRTLWYAIVDESIWKEPVRDESDSENKDIHLTKNVNGFSESVEPIPDIKPDSKPNTSESSNEDSSPDGDNQISKYEIYELLYGITDMKEGQKNKWRPAAAYVEKWLRQRCDQDRYPVGRIKAVLEHIREYHGSNGITGKVSVGYVEVALQKDVARWRMELEATAVMA